MSSELRKSLESIQSLLSQNPSPMTATSLSSRIHRASLESGGLENHHDDLGRSPPPSNGQSHREGAIRAESLNGEQRSSAVSFHRASAEGAPSSSLAPIAEPDSGSRNIHEHHDHGTLGNSTTLQESPQGQGRDSLSYTPFNHLDTPQQQQNSQSQHRNIGYESQGSAPAPATPFQNADITATTPFRSIDTTNISAAGMDAVASSNRLGIVGSPSSAFSAVGSKKISSTGMIGMVGMGSPPFGGTDKMGVMSPDHADTGGGDAKTPSGNSVMSGALGSVSSASRTGGHTAASSHFGGLDASAAKRTTFDHYHHNDGLDTMSTTGKQRHLDYSRETSLLVSPVSQQSSLHSRSRQSELSAILAGGTPSSGAGVFAGQNAMSPPETVNTVVAAAPGDSYDHTGAPFVDASAATTSPSATSYASQHASPPGTANTAVARVPASHGPTGTPFVGSTSSVQSPSAISFANQHTPLPGTVNTTAARASMTTNGATRHGPTGTPFVASSSATSRFSSSKNRTPATAGLTIHTNLQPANNGRDPTPYHNRSNQSTTSPYSSNVSYKRDKMDSDTSSTRIGRDPPAKSPFPTTINTTAGSDTSGDGFLASSKSSPNVHSRHHHKEHQAEEHELSMIEEDESFAEDNHSLVSNVTGPTFVRTPIGRKLHGHNHVPHNHTTASGGGTKSGNSHNRAHHTPRGKTAQHFHHTTPGSTTSTAIHATPSKAELLHRPSLAMRESLAHLASTTSNALEEIWDCIGVTPDERASQLADLVERMSELCEAKVQDEEAVRDQFRKEISEARKEWEAICNSLMLDTEEDPVSKLRRDPSSKDLGRSLQLEYEAMMARLESLRSVKLAAMADMQASQGKIFEAFAALQGCSTEEASNADQMQQFMDVETNLTETHRDAFRFKAEEYEESVASRTQAVVSLLLDCQSMIQELEIVPPSEVRVGRCEDDAKIMASLEPIDENGDRHDDGHRRGQSRHYTIASIFESPTCIGIGKYALDRLTNRIAELNGEKRRRRSRLGEMGSAIAQLWSMLRVPQEEQHAFTSSIRGLGLDTLRKGEAEIARLDELKNVMIGKLVREQRQTIEELWDKTNSSMAERESFNVYFNIQDDEQLTAGILVKHEDYVAMLKSKLEKMQPILDHIAKREAIIEERAELEFLQKDPDRLKGRHASKQLMREEQMNRRVKKELPRITSNLEKELWQWYEENKALAINNNKEGEATSDPELGHFMYQGSPYLKIILCQEEEWRTRKERGEQERQRKRQEERVASSSANAAFGYTTYTKLPGKKWNPSINMHAANTDASARPRSASNLRSGSNARSGSNMRSGGSHPTMSSGNPPRAGSNARFGGRGPLGDVSGRQNTSRPPSRPRMGAGGVRGAGGVKKVAEGGGRGYRPASAPRMRL